MTFGVSLRSSVSLTAFTVLMHAPDLVHASAPATPAMVEEAPGNAPRPLTFTTPSKEQWSMDGAIGAAWVRNTAYSADGSESRVDEAVESYWDSLFAPGVTYAPTDKLHISLLAPGISYRLGNRGATEWVPFLKSGLAMGFTSVEGFILHLNPEVGLSNRIWLGEDTALAFNLTASSYLRHRGGGTGCAPESEEFCESKTEVLKRGQGRLQMGLVTTWAKRVTFAPSLSMGLEWQEGRSDVPATQIHFLGSVKKGVWTDPLLRLHLNDYAALDLFASYTLDLANQDQTLGGALGATFLW